MAAVPQLLLRCLDHMSEGHTLHVGLEQRICSILSCLLGVTSRDAVALWVVRIGGWLVLPARVGCWRLVVVGCVAVCGSGGGGPEKSYAPR